jgi:hypothetical protein
MQPVREFSHKLRNIVLRDYKQGKAPHPRRKVSAQSAILIWRWILLPALRFGGWRKAWLSGYP